MKSLFNIHNFLLLLILIFFTACSQKIEYHDLNEVKYPKKVDNYFMDQNEETKIFLNKYFSVWNQKKVTYSKTDASWGLNYRFRTIYLENHRVAKPSWFKKLEENSNFENYNTAIKKAITLKNTNVRVLPTNSPMFYEPTRPGEGFPFDYNQNSLLKINTPLIVSHLSKDKAWAYIQSSIVGGWVKINDIAFVDEKFIEKFKTNNYYIAVKEKFPLYDNIFREYIKLATIFPKKEDKYLIAKADFSQNAIVSYIDIKDNEVEQMPILYNIENRIKIARALMNEPYGWGGLLNNRDCSSFTQDFFAPFGKFLSRNSKAQTKNGKYYDISDLSNENKKKYILKNAIPFSTLVYLKGHIMLYVGAKQGEPLVMHNMWSVRLKDKKGKQYRHIVGKASITTLEPGKDLKDFDEENNVLKKIRGIVIL